MSTPLLIAAAIILAVAVTLFVLRSRPGRTLPAVPVRDIPAIVARLQASAQEGALVSFSFFPPGEVASDANVTELQYRIQDGRLGFDWVLLMQPNIDGKDRVATFMRGRGHAVNDSAVQDIDSLRAEGGDLPGLAGAILRELYGFADDGEVRVFAEGFEWRDAAANSNQSADGL